MAIQEKALLEMLPKTNESASELLTALALVADHASHFQVTVATSIITATANMSKYAETPEDKEALLAAARDVVDVAIDSLVTGIRRGVKLVVASGASPDPWATKSNNEKTREQILSEMEGDDEPAKSC